MTLRWPVIASLAALFAGAGLAALVLAFCGETGGESGVAQLSTPTPFRRTVTRTPSVGTPAATPSPTGTPSVPIPPASTSTPASGPPPEDTPEAPPSPPPDETPPPGETASPGPEPTLPPNETPPPASPTQVTATPTPVLPTSTPPPALPDLVILGMFVSNDRLGVILGNQGKGALLAGQEVEFQVRGVMAETVTLGEALLSDTRVGLVFENQVIYEAEWVMVEVDPNDAIREEDDTNNRMVEQLAPDVAPDLAVYGVFRSGETQRLLVLIRNPTDAPATQAKVVVTVYLAGATDPTTAPQEYLLTIEPQGFETVEIIGVAALPGTEVRVVVEMTDPPDADPSNNVWEGTIS